MGHFFSQAFVDLGGKFDAGCTTHGTVGDPTFAPNLWHDDVMVHLGHSDFQYRQDWGTSASGIAWDTTQIYNNSIYLDGAGINAVIGKETLADVQKKGGDKGRCGTVHVI